VGILYVLDQTDEGFRPHELSIYTQGNVAMLFYESIPLLVNIRLLMMMQYDAIGAKYSNTPPRAKRGWDSKQWWRWRHDDAGPAWIASFVFSVPWRPRCWHRATEGIAEER